MLVLEFILGNLFIVYTVVLHILSPGTILDILTSFCNIWAVAGIFLIWLSIYHLKHGYSFWSRIQKKWKKVILIFAGVCGVVAVVNLVLILTPRVLRLEDFSSEEEVPEKEVCFSDGNKVYVFLLGGGIDKNGKLPKPVMWRVKKSAEYLKMNSEAVCVVTGGTLKWLPYPEAPELKRQLVKMGIAPERILVEDQAKDTIQNLQLGTKLLESELGVSSEEVLSSPVILVSSRYHLRRAERLARRMGFENVTGLGCRTPVFHLLMAYLREICAYVKLNARILLTGKPAKL
ncbi:MAG: YdcF family protein [Treponema sp.]|nr:YdcF family protein [Treponema sp.]